MSGSTRVEHLRLPPHSKSFLPFNIGDLASRETRAENPCVSNRRQRREPRIRVNRRSRVTFGVFVTFCKPRPAPGLLLPWPNLIQASFSESRSKPGQARTKPGPAPDQARIGWRGTERSLSAQAPNNSASHPHPWALLTALPLLMSLGCKHARHTRGLESAQTEISNQALQATAAPPGS